MSYNYVYIAVCFLVGCSSRNLRLYLACLGRNMVRLKYCLVEF